MFEAHHLENKGHWLEALYDTSSIYHLGAAVVNIRR